MTIINISALLILKKCFISSPSAIKLKLRFRACNYMCTIQLALLLLSVQYFAMLLVHLQYLLINISFHVYFKNLHTQKI